MKGIANESGRYWVPKRKNDYVYFEMEQIQATLRNMLEINREIFYILFINIMYQIPKKDVLLA